MTGRLVDMSFSLNRKQRITLEVDSDFRSLWDKLNQEPLLDIEIKKHRNKRSHSANAYFHVLVNKIAAETGESDDLVKGWLHRGLQTSGQRGCSRPLQIHPLL